MAKPYMIADRINHSSEFRMQPSNRFRWMAGEILETMPGFWAVRNCRYYHTRMIAKAYCKQFRRFVVGEVSPQ
jgi:hypothetical protein